MSKSGLRHTLGPTKPDQSHCKKLSSKFGVPKTVLLVNRAFVPPEKGGFWRKWRRWRICILTNKSPRNLGKTNIWPFTGVSRALRARNPEKVWNKAGPRESLEKSRKSLFGTFSRLFPESRDFFQTFSRLAGGTGAGGFFSDFFQTCLRLLSDFFQTFFRVSGPEGPRDPCK